MTARDFIELDADAHDAAACHAPIARFEACRRASRMTAGSRIDIGLNDFQRADVLDVPVQRHG